MKNTENSGRSVEWYRERIDYLRGFMREERYDTLCQTLAMRTKYMTLMAENTFHPHNASALVRHCEAFGVQTMHTVETCCKFDLSETIMRGTHKWVDIESHDSTAEALAALRKEGYRIVATTPHRESCTPESFDVTKGKFVLVFGTEHTGISDEVIAEADEFLKIPMCGMVESLNVSASAAILIYILSQRMRATVNDWHLSERERLEMHFRWLMSSARDPFGVLNRQFPDTPIFKTPQPNK